MAIATQPQELETVSLLQRPRKTDPLPEAPRTIEPVEQETAPVRPTHTPRPPARFRVWYLLALVAIAVAVGVYTWQHLKPAPLPLGIVSSNGRLEATQIDIATQLSGRIEAVLVHEGDFIEAGQVLARMDTRTLNAELREAEARRAEARTAVVTANAVVVQRRNELDLTEKVRRRSEDLVTKGFVSAEKLDVDRAQWLVSKAALDAARSQVAESEAAVQASIATIERIESDIDDSVLKAPVAGRVQYRLAEPSEVLAAGGKVVSVLDLSDVYMVVFLTETSAGQVRIGAEARLVLDAAPDYVIPATVRFVADQAQFTPKTVETSTERQKLVFRVKVQLDPDQLRHYSTQIKAGLPGLAYVRIDPRAQWPEALAVRLPPQ
jgi:HlyD family secretion protein